jgi:hypothetical protein
MDVLLAGVALISLLLAAAMSGVAWKLLRDGRRLSAARAEALADLAWSMDDDSWDEDRASIAVDAHLRGSMTTDAMRDSNTSRHANAAHIEHATGSADAARVELGVRGRVTRVDDARLERVDLADVIDRARDDDDVADRFRPLGAETPSMFASVAAVRQGRRLVLVAGACAVVAAAAAAVIAFEKRGALDFLERLTAVGATADVRASRASASAEPPLDLLSLAHVVEPDGSFVVRGLVQSRDDAIPAGVVAVVYVFDEEGRYIANASAALERHTLARGEQSAFEVRVTPSTPARIARYRIGFRTDGAGVVPHRDVRPPYRVDPGQPSAPAPGVREGART